MTNLPAIMDQDPAELGFPPTLPMELALRTGRPGEICASYGISEDEFERLKANPMFIAACEQAVAAVNQDGGAFKLKARAQAELYLKKMWDLTDPARDFQEVPANVRADIMKFTIRAAGLDGSIEQKAQATGKAVANALQININLG